MSTIKNDPGRVPLERPGQPGGKRDLNRRRRSEQLRQAGLKLFVERGVEKVTIDDIAKEAGTAKGNFYRYYSDKSDLVGAIIEPVATILRDAFDGCAERLEEAHDEATLFGAYQTLAVGLLPIVISHLDPVRLYLQENRAPAVGARVPIRALADEIRERSVGLTHFAVDHGLLRIPDPRISALAVVGAVEQLAWSVLGGHLDAPPDEIVTTLISLVLSGIRNPN